GLCPGLLGLGRVAVAQGDYPEARFLLEEAVEVTQELGEEYGRSTALRLLAERSLGMGDYDGAAELIELAQRALPDAGPAETRLDVLLLVATVARARGDLARAREVLEDVSSRAYGASLQQALAELAAEEAELDEARCLFAQARDHARADGR